MAILPDAQRKEWAELLAGKLTVRLTSLPLQLKLNALRVSLKSEKITTSTAVHELFAYCNANAQMFEKDLKSIFKNLN